MKNTIFLLSYLFLMIVIYSCKSDKTEILNYNTLNGEIDQYTEVLLSSNNDTLTIKKYYYNNRNRIDKHIEKHFQTGISIISYKYLYDSNNILSYQIITDISKNDSLTYKKEYIYNNQLNIETNSRFEKDGLLWFENIKNEYDKDGKVIYKRESLIGLKNNTRDTVIYRIKDFTFQSNGQIKERVIKSFMESYNIVDVKKTEYIYNAYNLEQELKTYQKGELRNTVSYEYKFDKNNNWIKKDMYVDNRLITSLNRIIEYK